MKAVITPCPLIVQIPKFLFRPYHSNGIQALNLLRRQLFFPFLLLFQPGIKPVAVFTLISGRHLKISVRPEIFFCVTKADLPGILFLLHPGKVKNLQPPYSVLLQLTPLEALTLTFYPGGNFPFLVCDSVFLCGQHMAVGEIISFGTVETCFPGTFRFPDHADALQRGNLLLGQALLLISFSLLGNPLSQPIAVLTAIFVGNIQIAELMEVCLRTVKALFPLAFRCPWKANAVQKFNACLGHQPLFSFPALVTDPGGELGSLLSNIALRNIQVSMLFFVFPGFFKFVFPLAVCLPVLGQGQLRKQHPLFFGQFGTCFI